MGGTRWDDEVYAARESVRATTSTPTFKYDVDVKAGKVAAKAHTTLDPYKMKGGMRESRDSDAHPNSKPIILTLDQTGSMSRVIGAIQKSLPALMGLLVRKNYLPDAQILISAIGDANSGGDYGGSYSEKAPLQMGQFESGIEIENDLTNLYIEGRGGGSDHETYEYMAYMAARHTSCDAWEKRGEKGYMFFIGDEMTYDKVYAHQVKRLIGDDLQEDIKTVDIFEELKKRWNVFFILPKKAANGGSMEIKNHWANLIGAEHVLELDNENDCAQLVAAQIGLCEDSVDMDTLKKDLKDVTGSTALATTVTNAVSKAYKGGIVSKVASDVLVPSDDSDSLMRL